MSCQSNRDRYRHLHSRRELNGLQSERLAPFSTVSLNQLDHIDAVKESFFKSIALSKRPLHTWH